MRKSIRKSVRKSTRKSVRKSTRKSVRKSRRKSVRKSTKHEKCLSFLKRKIAININEYKQGRWKTRQQAIAVSYSQTRDKYPKCAKFFEK